MTGHVDDLLPEYAAGILQKALVSEVESHLFHCNACVARLRAVEDAYTQLPLALPAQSPPPELRARLLRSIAVEGRFEGFVERVAAMLDIATGEAREYLAMIDHSLAPPWHPGPAGTRLLDLAVGPRLAHATCGLVRMAAGQHFPNRRHFGTEHVLVLQGGLVDSYGKTLRAGDEDMRHTTSERAFTALADVDLVYLVVDDPHGHLA